MESLVHQNNKADYEFDLSKLKDETLCVKFVQSTLDKDTDAFMKQCLTSNCVLTAFAHIGASLLLRFGFSRTSANGFTHRGDMFVASSQQFISLLPADFDSSNGCGTLLDIGAGDGGVTAVASQALQPNRVFATEVSWPMKRRLRRKGYTIVGNLEDPTSEKSPDVYDVVLCFNVLDRVDDPAELLRVLRKRVAPGGFVVLAVVLPFCAAVERLGSYMSPPSRPLPSMDGATCLDGATVEASFERLATVVLRNAGFEVVKFTKVPYLCRGDLMEPFYALPDVVLTLRPREGP